MLKVLLVDSWLLNNKVIEQDSQEYFNSHNIEYKFYEAINPQEALDLVVKHEIDIAYVDISSEQFDGIQLLRDIKSLDIRQPKIIAVTVLYDKKYRYEALKLKIYRYIYKPYDYSEIQESLEKYFSENYYSKESNRCHNTINTNDLSIENNSSDADDDSMEFEFDLDDIDDGSMEFDFDLDENEEDEDEIEHSKELMDAFNDSHKKVSAHEFLSLYKDDGIDEEELAELEEELDIIVSSILYDEDLEGEVPEIIYILEKYNRFLYMFSEFEELCKVINALVELLNNIEFSSLKRKKLVSKFIVAIIEDLDDWKEHVFILKDAVDVYYINASILNSYVQLNDIVK